METFSAAVREIERERASRVLVLAASHLTLDFLPILDDALRGIGNDRPIDVLLYCRGGEVGAARRIALLFAAASPRIGIIVPDRCQSAGTIVALAGREIIAGRSAIFSPVDPALQAGVEGDAGVSMVSTEDVRRFGEMARAWFRQSPAAADHASFSAITGAIFPPTLTAFYRATCEVSAICRELLRLNGDIHDDAKIEAIIAALMHGFHSHGFPLSGDDLAALGLPIRRDVAVERSAWTIAGRLRTAIGGGARSTPDDDWRDACIATRDECLTRWTGPNRLMPRWEMGWI